MRISLLLAITLTLLPAHADVVLDGSLGRSGPLQGPDFQITAELGRRAGPNLFHSFSDFSIAREQSATFSGPGGIERVVGRVTGPEISRIDGLLRSTLPDAELFLLNPNGVLFGPDARVDLRGALHVSSADYLRFSDGSRFVSRLGGEPLISAAPPEAFGFVTAQAGPIELRDAHLRSQRGEVTLSGGSITLHSTTAWGSERNGSASIRAPMIRLVAMGSPGELPLARGGVGERLSAASGPISLYQALLTTDLNLDAPPPPGPKGVELLGGSIELLGITLDLLPDSNEAWIELKAETLHVGAGERRGSLLFANSIGSDPAANLHIDVSGLFRMDGQSRIYSNAQGSEADAADGGRISIRAGEMMLLENSTISTSTTGPGNGGTLQIEAERLLVSGSVGRNSSHLFGRSSGSGADAGDGGLIDLQLGELILSEGGKISAETLGPGRAGNIHIVAGQIVVDGAMPEDSSAARAGIGAGSGRPAVGGGGAGDGAGDGAGGGENQGPYGDAGQIEINADSLHILNGALIASTARGDGDAGAIEIVANELELAGNSTINSSSAGLIGDGLGVSGEISIEATRVQLSDRSEISSDTTHGRGGSVRVVADEVELLGQSVISSSTSGFGNAGIVQIEAQRLHLAGHLADGRGSHLFSATSSGQPNAGSGGAIILGVGSLTLEDGGKISSETLGAGAAGRIEIDAESLLIDGHTEDGVVQSVIHASALPRSESMGMGDAGDIKIETERLELRNGGRIDSITRGAGRGGSIDIEVDGELLMSGRTFGIESVGPGDGDLESTPQFISSSIRTRSTATGAGAGAAGDIRISARRATLKEGASINASALANGGGEIDLAIEERLLIRDGEVTTSVSGGSEDGGNLSVTGPDFLILDRGRVTAQADAGQGGDILIRSDVLLISADSLVSASSRLGTDGRITLLGPNEFAGDAIQTLPGGFLDPEALSTTRCGVREESETSQLIVGPAGRCGPLPSTWIP